MRNEKPPRGLHRTVAAIAALIVLSGAGLVGVAAPSAAAAKGHGRNRTHAQRIGPLPKALRSLPGARDVLWDYTTRRVVPWTTRPAPCSGPHGRTLRPKSVFRRSVLGGEMRGWCPLYAGDVLLYVPTADALTSGSTSLTVPAGAVVTARDLRTTSGISTGAKSFKVTTAVAEAIQEAATTMIAWNETADEAVFATPPPVTPAELPHLLATQFVDPKSPYYAQVAEGSAWDCTIPHRERRLVIATSGAPYAGVAPLFVTPTAATSCVASRRYYAPAASPAESAWANAQVTPVSSYSATTRWPAGFFVESNRSLTRVYRVWVPWGAEVSFDAPWIAGAAHDIAAYTSGWAELRPGHPSATDPRRMQVWQPAVGGAAWPTGFLVGPSAALPTITTFCTSSPPSPTIVLSDGAEHPTSVSTRREEHDELCAG